MMNRMAKWIAFLIVFALVLTGCGGKGEETKPPSQDSGKQDEPRQEVSLNFFYNGFSESLTNEVKKMIEDEFPHITMNMILHGSGQTINDVIVSGVNVDIAAFTMGQLFNVMDLKLATDLTPLIEKHEFDLSRLSEGVLETVKGYSGDDEILVMPYELNNSVLLYNKGIFEKFGVAQPFDGMTWEDVYEAIEKTSREEDGVLYQGFVYNGANPVYKNQMGLPFVDPETNKAVINTDGWKRWLEVMTDMYKIENNQMQGISADALFFQEMTLAMRTGPNPLDKLPAAIESGLEWDAVSMPVFSGTESTGSQMNAPFYIIPPVSKDADTAFEVIAFLMSDKVQAWNARQGRVPIVSTEGVIEEYGKDLPFLEGTNYANAIFNEQIADPIRVTQYDGIVRTALAKTIVGVAIDGIDINTTLREAEEMANKEIQEAMK